MIDRDPYGLAPSPVPPAPARSFPPASWPTKPQLDYTQTAITVFLLTIGVSWVLYKLATNPAAAFAAVGRRHAA